MFFIHVVFQNMKEILYKGLTHLRNAGHSRLQAAALLQHFFRWPSPSVPIAITGQYIRTHILILIPLPGSFDLAGILEAIVGGTSVGQIPDPLSGKVIPGSDQMSQHLTSVNSLPHKGIIRKNIILVPPQFRSHKIRQPCFFHDLRHCSAVAEYIRQPKHLLLFCSQFLFKKPSSIEDMTNERFSRNQIAVWFQPHSSFSFPAPLIDLFLYLFKKFWCLFFNKFIELRLAGHKFVLRKPLHQVQYCPKAAHCLLSGLS